MSSMFFDVYVSGITEALSKIDKGCIEIAQRVILRHAKAHSPIYVFPRPTIVPLP